jgi:energy-coupling factor transport system permease protein
MIASKRQIHPLVGILLSITITIYALVFAKSFNTLYVLLGIYLLFILLGFYKAALRVMPLSIVIAGISKSLESFYPLLNRILGLMVAIIPGMNIRPSDLTRCLNQMHVPKAISLGMLIALSFIPLLKGEIKKIKEAIKIRGISKFNLSLFYRGFLVPLATRISSISDTLTLSLEGRGFKMNTKSSIYKKVKLKTIDIILIIFITSIMIVGAIL